MEKDDMMLRVIGRVISPLKNKEDCPRQGYEDAPEAKIVVGPAFLDGLDGLEEGCDLMILTWLHQAERDVLKVHPRGIKEAPLKGVFATRSPFRPNPIGLHRVTLLEKKEGLLRVKPLEVLDGTPVVDIKPVVTYWKEC